MYTFTPITCKAAVAWKLGEPLKVENIEVAAPKHGEVRIQISHAGLCPTDAQLVDGPGCPEGYVLPCIPGHEGAGTVESIGPGVTRLKPGDHVIPLYVPQCKECDCCRHPRANLCSKISATQNLGLMPDGTTRFTCRSVKVHHFMGISAFSQYTVVPEIAVAKINPAAPLDRVCLLGCGVSSGYGAVLNVAHVTRESTVAIWGLGAVGLAVAMGAKECGAKTIIGIDINETRFLKGKSFGCTECLNPYSLTIPIVHHIGQKVDGGLDYTFECVGNVQAMRDALDCAHDGWGECVVLGTSTHDVRAPPLTLEQGRCWRGCTFGGWKTVDQVPQLVELYHKKVIKLDPLITHRVPLAKINDAFKIRRSGRSIRTVISL
ncbi:alcohol dehydrogenase class-3 [Dermacentor silvarum]|uniref:alcohol dehydrogenase class-3 n=1 Tax=Dermacentor silvarum TaxID=543639 RepID=UPI002101A34B|nr:alcohol dehydrogenase class-3 [Dermacentor silvarum]